MRTRSLLLLAAIGLASSHLLARAEELAGRTYNLSQGSDFTFDPPNQDFSGITFNALTQTYFMTDNKSAKIFELHQNGTLIRTIDITGLAVSTTADAEGIAWMHGTTYALALHDPKEIAIVNILSTTTALTGSQSTFYDVSSGPGKPKGIAYAGWEDALYWVAKNAPMAVVKTQINKVTGQLDTLWTKNVDNLPVIDLADVAAFPRLSPNLILISESSKTVMEVDLTGSTAVLKSTFSTAAWQIPKAGGLLFNQLGDMVIVGKHASGVSQTDFNVFSPTSPIKNLAPISQIAYGGSP
jgi:uncharacterized protein YjiK